MRRKIVGIVVLMLVATTVVSATNINMKKDNDKIVNAEPSEPGLFEWWNVDQQQTVQNGYGLTLFPPYKEAQSFTPTKNKLTAVSLYLFKVGTPLDSIQLTVAIRDNLSSQDLVTKTIDTNVVTIATSGTWVLFDCEDISITPESTYYIVCTSTAGNMSNNYCWLYSQDDTYTRGNIWEQVNENPWHKIYGIGDLCFKTYFRKPLDISSVPQTVPSVPQASLTEDWIETQKLLASDGAANDNFGIFVSLSGDTALIGAMWDDDNGLNSGSAYVFVRTGTSWVQQAKLLPSDGAIGENFGCSVSLDGDTALIGARESDSGGTGSAYVFIRTGTIWAQQAKLLASEGVAGDNFGVFVSLSGDTALIGASHDDDNGNDSGSAYVFVRTGTSWVQQAKLLPSDGAAGDQFSQSVSLDGNTALIGAAFDDENGTDSGSAYVFVRTGTSWAEQAKLVASDGAAGDLFSDWTVSLDGDTALIGADMDDGVGVNSGSAYVFTRSSNIWTQQQKLTASDSAVNDQFGTVSLDGNTAIISAWYDDDNGGNSGSAYVFTKSDADLTFSIAGGLGVKVDITNNGTSDVTAIPWQIHVEGGMLKLINKTVSGTIDIPVGKTVTVKSGMFLGLGALSIAVWVADDVEVTTGNQFIIFTTVKE